MSRKSSRQALGFALVLLTMGCQTLPRDAELDYRPFGEPREGGAAAQAGEISRFLFSEWAGPEIPVWVYLPKGADARNAPILLVMHGAGRDADRYLREWVASADTHGFVVVAPEFSVADFKGSRRYNLGCVFDSDGSRRDEATWTFSAIEPLFDSVVAAFGSERTSYSIYGHSAGSQFVHRFLYYKPNARVDRYLAANAGWYTFPHLDIGYPYGLHGSGVSQRVADAALGKEVIVLLGDADKDRNHQSLRRTPEAMLQGAHRFARGQSFFQAAKDLADERGVPFRWKLQFVEGVAHKNGGMAPVAAEYVN